MSSHNLGSLRLKYNAEKLSLQVSIVRCTDLPPKDSNNGSSDPYVKLQLLPEKQHKVKTRVLRKTVDPVYDEDFTFYGINPNQLHATTLHFVVLSFDRYSRDDVIGEVICPLSGVDFKELEKQLEMTKEITPRNLKIRYQGRGELLVSLCYQPAANRLTVVVLKARNLPKMDFAGLCDPYVKIYLLYNNQRIAKKKTHVKKRTTNPVFNESFVFEVPYNEGLENISLEFLVLDWDRVTKNEVIGRLELGPRSGGPAQQHWNEVCNAPRRQIAEWHKLKE
ncbi:UNVERIFIED_CONTAM: Syt4 [Trichonephila clavipes]